MSTDSTQKLKEKMLDWARTKCDPNNVVQAALSCDTNLIESGVLDPVDFLELIALAEAHSGLTVDLSALDPQELVTISGLCRHLEILQTIKHG